MLNELLNALARLNQALYRYSVHCYLLLLWVVLLFINLNYLNLWLGLGLVTYLGLFLYRILKYRGKEFSRLVKIREENGMLPFLVGFNLALLLGPFGIILALYLAQNGD